MGSLIDYVNNIKNANTGIVSPTSSSTTLVNSVPIDASIPSKKEIEDLGRRQTQLQNEITYWRGEASKYQSYWNERKDCGGFKKPCNNWLDKRNDANRQADSRQAELDDITKNKLPDAQKRYDTLMKQYQDLMKQYQERLLVEAQTSRMANPEIQKSMNELEALMKKKKTLIIIVIVVAVLIAGTVGGYFYLKSKGKI